MSLEVFVQNTSLSRIGAAFAANYKRGKTFKTFVTAKAGRLHNFDALGFYAGQEP